MKAFLFLLMFLPLCLLAQKPEKLKHNPTSYVDDYADIYTPEQEKQLDAIIRSFFDTAQISLVTVKSYEGIEAADYTRRVGNHFGVGSKSNNGITIVHSIGDRHIHTAVGPGLEGDLTDYRTKQLTDNYAIPSFKNKDFFNGVRNLILAYINEVSPAAKQIRATQEARQKEIEEETWQNTKQSLLDLLFYLTIISVFIIPFLIVRYRRKKAREKKDDEYRKEYILKLNLKQKAQFKQASEKQLISTAEFLLKELPPSHELYRKYSHHVYKSILVEQYKKKREALRNAITNKQYMLLAISCSNIKQLYHDIIYVPLTPQQIANKHQRELREQKERKLQESKIKTKEKTYEPTKNSSVSDIVTGAVIGSILSSHNDDSYSNSSASNDSSSPSSDFGGGSFSGGGGGSDY